MLKTQDMWHHLRISNNNNNNTEQTGFHATLLNCIRKLHRSNLERDTGSPDVFRGFPHYPQANTPLVSRLGQDGFLPNPFQFVGPEVLTPVVNEEHKLLGYNAV